jgi:hypothetical protein
VVFLNLKNTGDVTFRHIEGNIISNYTEKCRRNSESRNSINNGTVVNVSVDKLRACSASSHWEKEYPGLVIAYCLQAVFGRPFQNLESHEKIFIPHENPVISSLKPRTVSTSITERTRKNDSGSDERTIIGMLTLLLMSLACPRFCVGLNFVTPSLYSFLSKHYHHL